MYDILINIKIVSNKAEKGSKEKLICIVLNENERLVMLSKYVNAIILKRENNNIIKSVSLASL